MRISIFKLPIYAIAFILILSSCGSHAYLSKADDLGENVYGAEVRYVLEAKKTKVHKGELIAIEDSTLFVLSEVEDNLVMKEVPISEIRKSRLTFALSKNYFLPMLGVAVIGGVTHGYGAAVSLPMNLIVGVILHETARSNVQYTDRDLTVEEMKMFARFPQGIPQGLDLKNIQRVDDD